MSYADLHLSKVLQFLIALLLCLDFMEKCVFTPVWIHSKSKPNTKEVVTAMTGLKRQAVNPLYSQERMKPEAVLSMC